MEITIDEGVIELWSPEVDVDGFYEELFTLYGNKTLAVWKGNTRVEISLPEWFGDGIRELVKNKIEQENNRGA